MHLFNLMSKDRFYYAFVLYASIVYCVRGQCVMVCVCECVCARVHVRV